MAHSDQIDELIKQATDPAQKAGLLVLQRLDASLDANTEAVVRLGSHLKQHVEDFAEHDKQEAKDRAFISGGLTTIKMMMAIGSLLATVIYGLTVWIVQRHLTENELQNVRLNNIEARLVVIETEHKLKLLREK